MRSYSGLAVCVAALALTGLARSDSIRIDGKEYADVLVSEGDNMVYVQHPATGEVSSAPRESVSHIQITRDQDQRADLKRQWRSVRKPRGVEQRSIAERSANVAAGRTSAIDESAVRSAQTRADAQPRRPSSHTRPESPSFVRPRQQRSDRSMAQVVTDGYVYNVDLRNVPLRTALKAILRSNNLDYAVENGFIWISSPQRIRHESFAQLETRFYEVRNTTGTLPKVVVRQPATVTASRAGGNAFAGGRNGASGGYASGPGYSSGRHDVGGDGGAATGEGYGGGAVGGRGGAGGDVGGAGGGVGTGHFINISDLFYNIDDRIVGETPAVIGLSGDVYTSW